MKKKESISKKIIDHFSRGGLIVFSMIVMLGGVYMVMRFAIQDSVNQALIEIYSSIDLPDSLYSRSAQSVIKGDARPYMSNGYTPIGSQVLSAPNLDAPTQYIPYYEKQLGVQFEVPYNPLWGNLEYRVTPYETLIQGGEIAGVVFGPMRPYNGVWERKYTMTRMAYASAGNRSSAILKSLSEAEKDTLKTEIVNGYSVIIYEELDRLHVLHMEVVGSNANYDFSLRYEGIEDEGALVNELVKVIQSIQFLDE